MADIRRAEKGQDHNYLQQHCGIFWPNLYIRHPVLLFLNHAAGNLHFSDSARLKQEINLAHNIVNSGYRYFKRT